MIDKLFDSVVTTYRYSACLPAKFAAFIDSVYRQLQPHFNEKPHFQHRRTRHELVHTSLWFRVHRWLHVPAPFKVGS